MLKKSIILCIGLLLFTNCNDEPIDIYNGVNQENEEEEETPPTLNTLIIKEINNGDLDFFFDTYGKIERVDDQNAFSPGNIRFEFEYAPDNLLTTQTYFFFSELARTVFAYNGNNPSDIDFQPFGNSFSAPINIDNNTVSYSETTYMKNVEFTFASNNLKKLIHFEITDVSTPTPIVDTSVDYSYDTNGNLIQVTAHVINENPVNSTFTFTYDDKRNAVAESMNTNTLPYLLFESHNSYHTYIIQRLIELSPNNILSNSKDQHDFSYEYNSDEYPISGTKTNATDNTFVNNLTFTYY